MNSSECGSWLVGDLALKGATHDYTYVLFAIYLQLSALRNNPSATDEHQKHIFVPFERSCFTQSYYYYQEPVGFSQNSAWSSTSP